MWTKSEYLQIIKLKTLPDYDDGYVKTKIRIYGDKIYIIFRGLNMPENYIECESFTVISSDSSLVYKKNITFK